MLKQSIEYQDVVEITQELDRCGVVCLEGVVPAEWLMQARAEVATFLAGHGRKDYWIAPPGPRNHSAASAFVSDPSLTALLSALARTPVRQTIGEGETVSSVLRILADPARTGDPWWFHYDASVVTMIVPLILPEDECQSGALVVFPNKRPFRRFVGVNIVEKALTQNAVYQRIIVRRLRQERSGHILDMKVGNAYLFWGYRTFHGNMPCAPTALRATLLLHCGRPHSGSLALRATARLHQVLRGLRRPEAKSQAKVTTGG